MIASTGTYSTAHSVHLTEQAHELGVDGFLVVTPYYNKPPPRGIVEHFKAIAAASDRPIIVYNIPQRVVVNIEPETMAELAEIPTVDGGQAGDRGARPGPADRRRDRARPLRGRATTSCTRSSSSAASAGSCVHANISSRGRVKEMIGFYKEGDVESRARDRRGARAARRGARRDDQPDPGQGGAEPARPRGRRAAAAARRGDRRGASRSSGRRSSASG